MSTKNTSPRTPKSEKIGEPNLDPLTGEPGAHPVGAGAGAAAGSAAGAAIGAAGGPVGIAIGAIVGGVAGGLAGKGVAEAIDPTAEEAFWRENHSRQEYARGRDYSTFEPAYRTGVSGYAHDRTFEEQEEELRRQYEDEISRDAESRRDDSTARQLEWEEARQASRAAYERLAQSRGLGV
jgi:phage tail tape-measure protein